MSWLTSPSASPAPRLRSVTSDTHRAWLHELVRLIIFFCIMNITIDKDYLDSLLADKDRLDWLQRKQGDVGWTGLSHREARNEAMAGHPGMTRARAATVRVALDRAMRLDP